MSIKCQCGARMACIDTRSYEDGVRRRYTCECGKRATTKEAVINFDVGVLPSGGQRRPHAVLAVTPKRTCKRRGDEFIAAAAPEEKG